jgi:hypothetical protein
MNPPNHPEVYSEEIYGETTWEEALSGTGTYRASKVCYHRKEKEWV